MTHTAIQLMQRFVAAAPEGKVTAGDLAIIAGLFDRAPSAGGLDAAFGLDQDWAEVERIRERDEAIIAAMPNAPSIRKRAGEMQKRLTRYASTAAFKGDRAAGHARNPAHADLFRILSNNRFDVPGLTTLRKIISDVISGT